MPLVIEQPFHPGAFIFRDPGDTVSGEFVSYLEDEGPKGRRGWLTLRLEDGVEIEVLCPAIARDLIRRARLVPGDVVVLTMTELLPHPRLDYVTKNFRMQVNPQ